jgi:phage terminase large subunit-like protein
VGRWAPRNSRAAPWLAQDEAARADITCVNRTTGVVVVASMALAAVAIIVTTYLLQHKPEPETSSAFDQKTERWHEERATCLEGGGIWVTGGFVGQGTCGYSSFEAAAAAVEAPSL